MSKTVVGGAASGVVEAKLVDVNGAPVSVIFDGSTDFVNGKVVVASKEGYTMMIDGEKIVNVENVHVDTPSAALAKGEVASVDVVPVGANVFAQSIGVSYGGTTALVKGKISAVVEEKLASTSVSDL